MQDQTSGRSGVSVIVPCHRVDYGLRATLDALRQQDFEGPLQVIVANDGGDPEVRRLCEGYGVACVDSLPAGSSYRARNLALAHCTEAFVAFTDSNKVPTPHWVRVGLEQLARLAVPYLAGRLAFVPHDDRGRDAAYWYQVYRGFPSEHYLRVEHFGVTGNLIVARDLFASVGPFDDRTFSGGDAEWGRRVHQAGYRQGYSSEFQADLVARSLSELKTKGLRQEAGRLRLGQLSGQTVRQSLSPKLFLSLLLPPRPLVLNREARLQRSWGRDILVLFVHWQLNLARWHYLARAWLRNDLPDDAFYRYV